VVILIVANNGNGFDPAAQRPRPSLGLASISQRVGLVEGTETLGTTPGNRTRLFVSVPLEGNALARPRLLLADDHLLVGEGLKRLRADEFEIVGVVEDGRALVTAAERLSPDVVVADIAMPHLNGIEATARIRQQNATIKVVILSMHQKEAYPRQALKAGVSGHVVKHAAAAELTLAIHAALRGQTVITPSLPRDVLAKGAREVSPVTLTPRQREILRLLTKGLTASQIARDLTISPRTVECHKYYVMEAHGLHSSSELVHVAIQHGIGTL
jgi:DNA-binding NarL/FixJ family response regulator